MKENVDLGRLTGNELVGVLAALSNRHRLAILAALIQGGGRIHVSQLARQVRLSRPLVHMHLQRLEAARLVLGHLEVSPEGKAMKFFEVIPFELRLTPEVIGVAAQTLDRDNDGDKRTREE